MLVKNIKKLRAALIKACDARIAEGKKIGQGSFTYCPVGLAIKGMQGISYQDQLSEVVGFEVSLNEMFSFISGYDNWLDIIEYRDQKMFDLGKELREKYK